MSRRKTSETERQISASAGKTASTRASAAFPESAPRDRRKYEALLPEEFYEEQQRMPVVYLPIGAMEEHGLQNSLAVDPWTAYEICLRAANRLGGIVHPIVPIAPPGHPAWSREELRGGAKDRCPPSVWVGRETCRNLYVELLESFADLGFKACLAFSGHWPGDYLLQQIEQEHGGVIRGMKIWGGGTVRILKDVYESGSPAITGHGMMSETSIMMAIDRRWVDLARVSRIKDSPISHQLKDRPAEHIAVIRTANADYGNELLDLAAERLARTGRRLLG
ncbi:MAG: creatininase family protein [Planctomycetes bacterium]|nr:creatininase family protein [Planctomycetota bacterium]